MKPSYRGHLWDHKSVCLREMSTLQRSFWRISLAPMQRGVSALRGCPLYGMSALERFHCSHKGPFLEVVAEEPWKLRCFVWLLGQYWLPEAQRTIFGTLKIVCWLKVQCEVSFCILVIRVPWKLLKDKLALCYRGQGAPPPKQPPKQCYCPH